MKNVVIKIYDKICEKKIWDKFFLALMYLLGVQLIVTKFCKIQYFVIVSFIVSFREHVSDTFIHSWALIT